MSLEQQLYAEAIQSTEGSLIFADYLEESGRFAWASVWRDLARNGCWLYPLTEWPCLYPDSWLEWDAEWNEPDYGLRRHYEHEVRDRHRSR